MVAHPKAGQNQIKKKGFQHLGVYSEKLVDSRKLVDSLRGLPNFGFFGPFSGAGNYK